MKAKRPESIIISIDMAATDNDIVALIKNLENSPTVFKYQCSYVGKVVSMKDAIDLSNANNNRDWD
jgi:hypothetical protein